MESFFDYTGQVEFTSSATVGDALRRLKTITQRGPTLKSTLVGRVDEERVVLHRSRAWTGNWYKPFFYGKLYNIGNKTILKGKFSLSKFMRIGFIIQAIILSLLVIVIIFSTIGQNSIWQILIFLFFLIIAVGLGIPMTAIIKRFSRDDVDWISDEIKTALGNHE